jgi:hypothetical protein
VERQTWDDRHESTGEVVEVLTRRWVIAGLVAVAIVVIVLLVVYSDGGSNGGGVGGY